MIAEISMILKSLFLIEKIFNVSLTRYPNQIKFILTMAIAL